MAWVCACQQCVPWILQHWHRRPGSGRNNERHYGQSSHGVRHFGEVIIHSANSTRRFGETVELKAVYLFLASNASSYVTGADILVDGGYTAT